LPSKPKKPKSSSERKSSKTKKNKPYKHPIPSRNDLLDMLTDVGKPIKVEPILKAYSLKGQRMRSLLIEQLQRMVRAGQILENRRGEYCLTAKLDLITGKVSGHRDGFGFVIRDDGESEDVFLSAREMRSLFDGDRVAVRLVGDDHRGRSQGELVDVLERGIQEIAGQFIRERGIGIVIPDNAKLSHRILIPKDESSRYSIIQHRWNRQLGVSQRLLAHLERRAYQPRLPFTHMGFHLSGRTVLERKYRISAAMCPRTLNRIEPNFVTLI